MISLKSLASLGMIAGILSPALASFALVPTQMPARSSLEGKISIGFPPAENRGAPARTAGGGVRGGDCIEPNATPMTALMPTNNVGTTVAANPTLFVYVPETKAKEAELAVVDKEGNEIFQKVALTGQSGIVKVTLPENASLKAGKEYEWIFSLVCNPAERSGDIFIQGVFERTELSPDVTQKLENAEPLAKAQLYAEAKVWNETLNILAELRSSQPDEWEGLLKSVGLEAIATAPFVNNDAQ